MYMLDAKTGDNIWHHHLAKRDFNIATRLEAHGYWTPTTVKMHFYGKN
jgi:hypothetical protein